MNRISAGLVASFAASDIARYLVLGHGRKRHPGNDYRSNLCTAVSKAHAGHDLVRSPGESSQHGRGVFVVPRLSENQVVDDDCGVRAQHRDIPGPGRQLLCDGRRLHRGKSPNVLGGRLTRTDTFVNIGRDDVKRKTGQAQQVGAPRRGRSEDQPHATIFIAMQALSHVIPDALLHLLRDVPLSGGKVEFAWRAAVGPALGRATHVRLEGRVLLVDTTSAPWSREVLRSSPVILRRLQELLGPETVERIEVRRA